MTAASEPRGARAHLVAGAARLARLCDGSAVLAPIPRAVLGMGGQAFAARARNEAAAGVSAPHPLARMLLEQVQRPLSELPLDAARAAFKQLTGLLPPGDVAEPVPFTLTAGGHKVGIRVYGRGRADLPLVCYFHGGAFVLGDLDTSEPECGAIASISSAAVVSVGYPRAPEQRFPVPVEVSLEVLRQVLLAPERFGIVCANRVVLAGESSGANIALNCALALRDEPRWALGGLALVCPMVDLRPTSPSVMHSGEHLFSQADLERFVASYLSAHDAADPVASPLLAEDLTGLPPTIIISAELDPLLGQAGHLARRLSDAGVDAHHTTYGRLIHGFLQWRGILPERLDALDRIAGLTRRVPAAARPEERQEALDRPRDEQPVSGDQHARVGAGGPRPPSARG